MSLGEVLVDLAGPMDVGSANPVPAAWGWPGVAAVSAGVLVRPGRGRQAPVAGSARPVGVGVAVSGSTEHGGGPVAVEGLLELGDAIVALACPRSPAMVTMSDPRRSRMVQTRPEAR